MYWLLDFLGYDRKPNDKGLEPNYDISQVESISPLKAVQLIYDAKDVRAEGQLAIPSVGLNLDIYEGINNTHLFLGAGEQLPRDKVKMGGYGNYILASHLSDDPNLLFSPLKRVQVGDMIYTTNGKRIFSYKITLSTIVSVSETGYLNEQPKDEKLITLYTCTTYGNDPNRYLIRGEYTGSKDINDATDSELRYFLNGKNEMTGYLKYYYLGYY